MLYIPFGFSKEPSNCLIEMVISCVICFGEQMSKLIFDQAFFWGPGPEVIKLFMLNSTEHQISAAHKKLKY